MIVEEKRHRVLDVHLPERRVWERTGSDAIGWRPLCPPETFLDIPSAFDGQADCAKLACALLYLHLYCTGRIAHEQLRQRAPLVRDLTRLDET